MEKTPRFDSVGNAPEPIKEKVGDGMRDMLFKHADFLSEEHRELFAKMEYPKSEQEIALIHFANQETNRLLKEAGMEPYDVPVENYYIIPPELYKVMAPEGGVASTHYGTQEVLFDGSHFQGNPVNFGNSALHETLLPMTYIKSFSGRILPGDFYRSRGLSKQPSAKEVSACSVI